MGEHTGDIRALFEAALAEIGGGHVVIGDTRVEAREVDGGRPFHVLFRRSDTGSGTP